MDFNEKSYNNKLNLNKKSKSKENNKNNYKLKIEKTGNKNDQKIIIKNIEINNNNNQKEIINNIIRNNKSKIKIPKLEGNNYNIKNSKLPKKNIKTYPKPKKNQKQNKNKKVNKKSCDELNEYDEENFYFSVDDLNYFEKNFKEIFITKIKEGEKYQANIDWILIRNQKKIINLKNYKIDPDKIFKNENFIKDLNKYKKIIQSNYNFWLTDSEIFNFYSHFKNFDFFKNILLTQNELLYNYISNLKNKKSI